MPSKTDYRFRGQASDEKVILFVRHHPVVLLHAGYIILAISLVPWVVFVFASFTAPFGWTLMISTIVNAWLIFEAYYTWVNDIYVLTNKRVLATNQRKVFEREVKEVRYDRIQEVSHETKGFYTSMLNVGSVFIKTAAGVDMTLSMVPNPYDIEQKIAQNISH